MCNTKYENFLNNFFFATFRFVGDALFFFSEQI